MNISTYRKTGLFYGLSTLIPWTLWLLAGYISHIESSSTQVQQWVSIIAFIGLLAPVIVTLFLAKGNRAMQGDLRARLFNFIDIKPTYVVLTIILMPISILLAQGVSLLFGFSIRQFQLAETFSFTSGVFPVWILLVIAPLLEELAWHSYGTDALRSRYSLFTTSILFALFWGIWHVPLSTIKDYYHSNLMNEGWIYSTNFLLSLFPFVIIMNWIYYKAKRNIVLPILFHISAGYFNEIFATHPMSKVIQTVLLALFALYIILNDKEFFFTKSVQVAKYKYNSFLVTRNTKFIVLGLVLGVFLIGSSAELKAQTVTQTISGKVFDDLTKEPLPFATITIKDSDPFVGTVADEDGNFLLPKINVGRQTIQISMVGYDTYEIKELLISSGQIKDLNPT